MKAAFYLDHNSLDVTFSNHQIKIYISPRIAFASANSGQDLK